MRIDIDGRHGRGNPDIGFGGLRHTNRLNEDKLIIDPDGDLQDSAQAIEYETMPSVQIERDPLSLGSLLLAVVIVCLCAATVIVACDAGAAEIDCVRRVCT